ncbi:hypothetical protein KRP22_009727 [Phytophthora ramorum]|nr:Crinkler effector protein 8 [Phytophthora ramorum]
MLYLAKGRAKGAGEMKDEEKKCEWVESGSEDVKKLKKGEVTSAITRLATEINKLHEEFSLENKLRKVQPPVAEQIYVLVRVPLGKKSLEWLNGLPTSLLVSKRRNLEWGSYREVFAFPPGLSPIFSIHNVATFVHPETLSFM